MKKVSELSEKELRLFSLISTAKDLLLKSDCFEDDEFIWSAADVLQDAMDIISGRRAECSTNK